MRKRGRPLKRILSLTVKRKGWAWPAIARIAHYFINQRSLCGRWTYSGDLVDDQRPCGLNQCRVCLARFRYFSIRDRWVSPVQNWKYSEGRVLVDVKKLREGIK